MNSDREADLARYRAAAAPILGDLAAAGFAVETIAELRHNRAAYPVVVPVLARWLAPTTEAGVRADILRVLGVARGGAAAPVLAEEFRRAPAGPGPGARWSVGNALAETAHDAVFDDVAALARDRGYGRDREMVVVALGRMRDPRAVDVLLELVGDHEVAGHAAIALGRLRAARARPALEGLAHHREPWVRREAAKALKRIGA